ncbi:MAG: hypothetical protein RL230_2946 [Pseudomonadota bacterium]
MAERFQGQSILITGAASGLGAACARAFAAEGALLALVDLNGEKLAALRQQLPAKTSILFAGDVGQEETALQSVELAMKAFGRIDVLVNNAGIDPLDAGSIEDTSVALWDQVMEVNLRGAFLFAKNVLGPMKGQRRGSMVHTSSISGLRPTPEEAAYSVSKAGLIQLSRSLALDFGKYGIRSNCVCPGFLEAVMGDRASSLSQTDLAARSASATALVPLGREGRYSEITAAILFLASAESAYINGATLVIDGGMTLA